MKSWQRTETGQARDRSTLNSNLLPRDFNCSVFREEILNSRMNEIDKVTLLRLQKRLKRAIY